MPPHFGDHFRAVNLGPNVTKSKSHEWTPPPSRIIKMSRTTCHLDWFVPPRHRSSFSGSQLGTKYRTLNTSTKSIHQMSQTMCHLDIGAHFLAPDLGPLTHRIGIVAPKFKRCEVWTKMSKETYKYEKRLWNRPRKDASTQIWETNMFSLGFFCLALGYDIYVSIETYMYEKRL